MTTVVVSQPMLFPWIGLLEQLRLADVWVHYDDVQFSKGSFFNRVQVKTAVGSTWMTLPLRDARLGSRIDELEIANDRDWRASHIGLLDQALAESPHCSEMLTLVRDVYGSGDARLAEVTISSFEALAAYFGLATGRKFLRSSTLAIGGESSRRVLDVVKAVGGDVYVTGHGARNYLDHALFGAEGVEVRYMDYRMTPYPQLHGVFTPYVTALDLVANVGGAGAHWIASQSVNWKEFLAWKK